jgi:hypothetical protein
VATGAGAAKVSAALACAIVLAILGYLLYGKYAHPFSTQDITEKSTVTVADATPAEAPRKNPLEEVDTTKEPAPDGVQETVAAPVVPKVYGVLTGTAASVVKTKSWSSHPSPARSRSCA